MVYTKKKSIIIVEQGSLILVLYIPLTNRVQGLYRKLRAKFFPLRFMAQARSHKSIGENEDLYNL